jgi:hypothetical protein
VKAMCDFLSDYPRGKLEARYMAESAPILSFPDDSFGLAVVSHFLFLYSDHLDLRFHIDPIPIRKILTIVILFVILKTG